jgi:ABC-type Na+ transport system ATPase subunit NatA
VPDRPHFRRCHHRGAFYPGPASQQEIRRIAGLLPEAPGLYDTLSAHANLDFYGKLYGMPQALRERSIREVLEKFDLWDRRDDAVGTFSRSMRQKVAIARAILHDPTYLFLDEPTASTPRIQKQFATTSYRCARRERPSSSTRTISARRSASATG